MSGWEGNESDNESESDFDKTENEVSTHTSDTPGDYVVNLDPYSKTFQNYGKILSVKRNTRNSRNNFIVYSCGGDSVIKEEIYCNEMVSMKYSLHKNKTVVMAKNITISKLVDKYKITLEQFVKLNPFLLKMRGNIVGQSKLYKGSIATVSDSWKFCWCFN